MKALIMAAGIGSRISRYLNNQPKCCVKIGKEELIRYTFSLLNKKGITDIAIVTGYNDEYIFKALEGFEYKNYKNNFYDVTNSIASTWFAQEFLDANDNMLVMNGDVFVEEKILDIVLQKSNSPLFLSDSSRIEDADYKFKWIDDKLVSYGKDLSDEETTGEYVGIAKISKDDLPFMKQELNNMISNQKHHYWWEDIFYRNCDKKSVYIYDVRGIFWAEVDYIEDYERIKMHLSNKGKDE